MARRRCSRPSCARPALATLTYVYADSTAVLGPLATYAEPHCYDLCDIHSERLTAPRGWEIVRITPDPDSLRPTSDDLEALADAVREAARPRFQHGDAAGTAPTVEVARRGHLRMLASAAAETDESVPAGQANGSVAPPTSVAEPNWHLGEDEELDELIDDDDDSGNVDLLDESLDELIDRDAQGDDIDIQELDEFTVMDEYVLEDPVPGGDSTGRAKVLNLPLRSQGAEREPS